MYVLANLDVGFANLQFTVEDGVLESDAKANEILEGGPPKTGSLWLDK